MISLKALDQAREDLKEFYKNPRKNKEVVLNMPTEKQCEAEYHCGIGNLLTTAYRRDFTMVAMGKCKTKLPTFREWYATSDLCLTHLTCKMISNL